MVGGIFRVIDQQSMGNIDPRTPGATRFYYCLAWGVVARPPLMKQRKKDNMPSVEFSIQWRRNQYINCRCYKDNPFAYEICQQLLPGDPVVIFTHCSERDYVPKKGHNAGKPRIERRGMIQAILPMRVIAGVMTAMKDSMDAPDILEGLDEYLRGQAMEESKNADYEMPF